MGLVRAQARPQRTLQAISAAFSFFLVPSPSSSQYVLQLSQPGLLPEEAGTG